MVSRKPICRPKDNDSATFRFLLIKTGFLTFSLFYISLPKYSITTNILQYLLLFYENIGCLVLKSFQKAHRGSLFMCELKLMYTLENLCLDVY